MNSKLTMWIASLAVLVLPLAMAAQEEPMGQKYEDAEWYEVTRVDFHPGKTERAMEIIRDHFAPATGAAGTAWPSMVLWHNTGDVDVTVVWKMDGPEELRWQVHPDQIKWMQALAEQLGGMEKAQELLDEYQGLIARMETDIAHTVDLGTGGGDGMDGDEDE